MWVVSIRQSEDLNWSTVAFFNHDRYAEAFRTRVRWCLSGYLSKVHYEG